MSDESPDLVTVEVPIGPGDDGYMGMVCPSCTKYFKVMLGTGGPAKVDPSCPYCRSSAKFEKFIPDSLRDYAMLRGHDQVMAQLIGEMQQNLVEAYRGNPNVKIEVPPPKVAHRVRPAELELETETTCEQCTLTYSVYGVFARCPECGNHNSAGYLNANLEVLTKDLVAATNGPPGDCARRIANVLQDCVSTFDAFGRENCRLRAASAATPAQVAKISFQGIVDAKDKVIAQFGVDFSAGFSPAEWDHTNRLFQKRHLFAHGAGVVDQKYIDKSQDSSTPVGRKVPLVADEVAQLLVLLRRLGADLLAVLPPP